MVCRPEKLVCEYAAGPWRHGLFTYTTDVDNIEQVLTPDYFEEVKEELREKDIILIKAGRRRVVAFVYAITPRVEVSPLSTHSDAMAQIYQKARESKTEAEPKPDNNPTNTGGVEDQWPEEFKLRV